jgi:hypothetical protein
MRRRRKKYDEIPDDFPIPVGLTIKETEEVIQIYRNLKTIGGYSTHDSSLWQKVLDMYMFSSIASTPDNLPVEKYMEYYLS